MTTAVVPGSFDPVTLGHLDVMRRATRLFDAVHVVVVHNPEKSPLLPVETRVALIRDALAGEQVTVASWSGGLLVDYCRQVGAGAIVKGVRQAADAGYEFPMAALNRELADVETVLLPGDPALSHVSSTLVRQIARLGGDVARYVPPAAAAAIARAVAG